MAADFHSRYFTRMDLAAGITCIIRPLGHPVKVGLLSYRRQTWVFCLNAMRKIVNLTEDFPTGAFQLCTVFRRGSKIAMSITTNDS